MALAVPGIPRAKNENPFKYTDDQLAERKLALKHMHELWPDVNPLHAEWVYDLCKNTPEDELKVIMEKTDTVPSRFKATNDPESHLYQPPTESSASWKAGKKNYIHNR